MTFACVSCNPRPQTSARFSFATFFYGAEPPSETHKLLNGRISSSFQNSCCKIYFGIAPPLPVRCQCSHYFAISVHTDQFWEVAKASWDHKLPQGILALVSGASSFLGPTALLEPDLDETNLSPTAISLGVISWLFSSAIKFNARQHKPSITDPKGRYAVTAFAIASVGANFALTYVGMKRLWANTFFQTSMGLANGISMYRLTTYSFHKLHELFQGVSDEQGIRYGKLFSVIFFTIFAGYCTLGKVFAVNTFFIDQWGGFSDSLAAQVGTYFLATALNIPTWALLVVSIVKLFNKILPYFNGKDFQGDGYTLLIDIALILISVLGSLDYAGLVRVAFHEWVPEVKDKPLWDWVITCLGGVPRYATSLYSLQELIAETFPSYAQFSYDPKTLVTTQPKNQLTSF